MQLVKPMATLLFYFSLILVSCKKNSQSSDTTFKGFPTAVGTPDGAAVTKSIGTAGGSMISSDNRFEIIVPSGALGANSNISIQPITNNAPGGSGKAYRLLPDGLKFSKPVSLVLHYTPEDINGTTAELLGIAVQDTSGIWRTPFQFTVNETAGTITSSTTHFTDYSIYAEFRLVIEKDTLLVNESTKATVEAVMWPDDYLPPLPGGAPNLDFLADMPKWETYHGATITWLANSIKNGNEITGTISSSNPATYTAPATAPAANPVAVAAELRSIKRHRDKLLLLRNVFIKGEYKFKLTFNFERKNTSGIFADVYTDYAEMQINVKGGNVTFSNIVNAPPSVSPSSGKDASGVCSLTWQPDPVGMMNVVSASGVVVTDGYQRQILGLNFTHSGTVTPRWSGACNGSPISQGGDANSGVPAACSFFLKDSAQTVLGQSSVILKLTPI